MQISTEPIYQVHKKKYPIIKKPFFCQKPRNSTKKKAELQNSTHSTTWGEKNPGELSNPEGLNPGGTVNIGERAITRLTGLLCLKPMILILT